MLNPKHIRAAKLFLLLCAALYAVVLLTLYFGQQSLLYHPVAAMQKPAEYGLFDMQEARIQAADKTQLVMWSIPARPGQPTIAFFHGNAGNLGGHSALFHAWMDAGFGIVAISYRGFGGSGGSPGEAGILSDARAALVYAEKTLGLQAREMIFYGESLGTGVAVRMASETAPRLLVLQSPYTSIAARAQEIYYYVPVNLLIRDRFESLAYLPKVHAPVLILHGEADAVIPVTQGRAMLAAANSPKRGIFFANLGHHGFPSAEVIDAMRGMLKDNGVQP